MHEKTRNISFKELKKAFERVEKDPDAVAAVKAHYKEHTGRDYRP
ncbi:MAG: hypothetical protein ABH854_03180 [Candidatus Diapherotrites archaeon]